ncbi:MAG TPA: hypothetical protein VKR06_09155 [Ktedonosporobacter sp.]|nr:hypothetical protein [Ktedonosporobacter sp.]
MPTTTEKSGMTPKSVLRHRPIVTTLGVIPITTPRRPRAQQKREPHTTGGPPFVAEAPKRSRSLVGSRGRSHARDADSDLGVPNSLGSGSDDLR